MAENTSQNQNVVVDNAASKLSDLWTKEDYWAIWLGALLLIVGCMIFLPRPPAGMQEVFDKSNAIMQTEAERAPFKTVAWYQAQDAKEKFKASGESYAKAISKWLAKPKGWTTNPMDSLILSQAQADAMNAKAMPKYEEAKQKTAPPPGRGPGCRTAAMGAAFQDASLNEAAKEKVDSWRKARGAENKAKGKTQNKPYNLIPGLIGLMVGLALFFSIGIKFMGKDTTGFLKGFAAVFALATLAYLLAGQATMKHYGVGDAVWAIFIGMLVANTIGTPKWVKPALEVEFYIKTGLVLLGAEVLFNKVVAIGVRASSWAWVVTPIVLICTFIFGQKVLKIPPRPRTSSSPRHVRVRHLGGHRHRRRCGPRRKS
jgi:hypothetical protein